jgi:hypothetical protein
VVRFTWSPLAVIVAFKRSRRACRLGKTLVHSINIVGATVSSSDMNIRTGSNRKGRFWLLHNHRLGLQTMESSDGGGGRINDDNDGAWKKESVTLLLSCGDKGSSAVVASIIRIVIVVLVDSAAMVGGAHFSVGQFWSTLLELTAEIDSGQRSESSTGRLVFTFTTLRERQFQSHSSLTTGQVNGGRG